LAAAEEIRMTTTSRPLVSAGTVLGIGLGGFFDGILFHQLLQLHNMLTGWIPKTTIPDIEINMFWDGIFHAVTWVATMVGLVMLFRAGERPEVPWSRRILIGSFFLGWGLFNFVEGIIDHHILEVHHVYENAGLSIWDWAFLGSGVLFIAFGWSLIRAAASEGDHRLGNRRANAA
jgi:uncharacterized membrane protein